MLSSTALANNNKDPLLLHKTFFGYMLTNSNAARDTLCQASSSNHSASMKTTLRSAHLNYRAEPSKAKLLTHAGVFLKQTDWNPHGEAAEQFKIDLAALWDEHYRQLDDVDEDGDVGEREGDEDDDEWALDYILRKAFLWK